jgi:DNA-binding response OmpR family regulator
MTPALLLLEDDLQLNETIKQFLELKGYQVFCAYDGLQAQDILYEKHIDLMLLDVKVPHIDGFKLLKDYRNNAHNTPAIFITSLNSVEDVEKGFSLGCDDYIRKPFALKELLVRIESLLKRTYGTHASQIKLGSDLLFDIKELLLLQNGQKVPLKTKELKLLALFLTHSNELLEYETIFEALWDYDEDPSSGSLRAYIKTLRHAVGKEKIETIKNIGYRFVNK